MADSYKTDTGAVLCIGDFVALYYRETQGFVYSSQSSSAYNRLAVGINHDVKNPHIGDPNMMLFQVLTQNRYKANKAYMKLKAKSAAQAKNFALAAQVARNQKAAETENKDNRVEQKRLLGKPVHYGETIQLKHLFTGKFLHINNAETSELESNNVKAELLTRDGKTAQFRMNPRYKVKSVGESVRPEDLVAFESVKSTGHYLHSTIGNFNTTSTYVDNRELNVCVLPSGFTIYKARPSSFTTKDMKDVVKGGSVLRLFHKEKEAFMTAEGQFNDEICENVHLRVRPLNVQRKTTGPPASAVTSWMVVKEKCVYDEGEINWSDSIRLLHMTTRQYLIIRPDETVGLTADKSDPLTLLKFHPINKKAEKIIDKSYIRIQSVSTKLWLISDGQPYQRLEDAAKGDAQAKIKTLIFSKAELKQLKGAKDMSYEDAFAVFMVDEDDVVTINYIAGQVPFLKKLQQDCSDGAKFDDKQTLAIYTALTELENNMVKNGQPVKHNQRLLRDYKIVDTVIKILKEPVEKSGSPDFMKQVHSKCYSLLQKYLDGGSRKNEMYIARHYDFLVEQLFIEGAVGLNATYMLMELLKDNIYLVDSVTEEQYDKFVGLMIKNKNFRYLKLFEVLCIVNNVALADKQNFIVNKWLVEPLGNKEDVLYFLSMGQDIGLKEGIVYLSSDNKRSWMPVPDFCKVNDESSDAYQFLLYQLSMFGSLCKGRNTYASKVIVNDLKLFSMEMAFICLQDRGVARGIRAMFVRNIADIFIDIHGNSSSSEVSRLIFIYDDIVSLDDMKKGKKVSFGSGSAMPVQYMKELKTWIEEFLTQHAVMRASETSENNLIEQVLALIYNLADFGYYDTSELVALLKPILAIVDGRTDLPFPFDTNDKELMAMNKDSLTEYQKESRFVQNPKNKAVVDAKVRGCNIVELVFRNQFNFRLYRYIQEFKSASSPPFHAELAPFLTRQQDFRGNMSLHKLALRKCEDIFHETQYFDEAFVGILLDLQGYTYPHLITQSLQLLNEFYSPHDNLFEKSALAKLTLNIESVFTYRKVASDVPNLKTLKSATLNKANATQIMDMMFDFTKMCCLESDTREPHSFNQQLIYTNDIIGDVFDLLQRVATTADATPAIRINILRSILRFLKSFAKRHVVVQNRLFDRLEFLLTIENVETELGEMVTEVFEGNMPNCLRIADTHVKKIVQLYAVHYHPVWMGLLANIACAGGFPIKRNQNLVLKGLMHYEETLGILTETTLEQKVEILRLDEAHQKDKFELKLRFCNVMNLLATCAQGENKAAESICQCLLILDDLLELVNVEELCSGLRGPFVRFLTWVYLNSNSTTAVKDVEKFGGDERFISLVYRLDSTINETVTIIKAGTHQAIELLRQKPAILHTSYLDEIHEKKEIVNYMCDGVIPLTQVIFAKHFKKTLKISVDQMENFVRSLCNYAKLVTPCLSRAAHRLELMNTIRLANTATRQFIACPKELEKKVEVLSETRRKYEIKYRDELKLNDNFQLFTRNLHKSYQGKNTVKTQLGLNSNRIYVQLDTEERLPLGSDFQKMVKAFLPKGTADSSSERLYEVGGVMLHLKHSVKTLGLKESAKIKLAALDHKLLQLLRAMVHNEMARLPASKTANPSLHDRVMEDIVATQNHLNNQGVVDCVLPHLGRTEEAIVKEVLYFFNLLYRGTDQTPQAFVHFVNEHHHEAFFVMVKRRLEAAANLIKEQKFLVARYAKLVEQSDSLKKAESQMFSSQESGYGEPIQSENLIKAEVEEEEIVEENVENDEDNDETQLISEGGNSEGDKKKKGKSGDKPGMSVALKPPYLTIYKDTSYINVLLNMLQSLCDGQYVDAQNLVREQPNAISINLVAQVCDFLSLMCSNINVKYIGMASNCFDTVGEFVRGNKLNQSTAFDNKVIDSINAVLLNATFKDCSMAQRSHLLYCMGHLLMYMTEENHKIDSGAPEASVVMGALDRGGVWRVARECYKLATKGQKDQRESFMQTGFLYFCTLRRAKDLKLWEPKKSEYTWNYYDHNAMSVEFIKGGVIQRFHFRVVDQKTMRAEIEEKLNWEVDRLNPGKKLIDFMDWAKDSVTDVKVQRQVNRNPISGLLAQNWKLFNYLSMASAAVTQLAILAVWDGTNETVPILRPALQENFNEIIMKGVGSVHNIVSFCLFFSFFFTNMSGFISWKNRFVARTKLRLIRFKMMSKPKKEIVIPPSSKMEISPFSGMTMYYLLFIGMSLAGSIASPAFNSFHLLQLIQNNQLLARVIKAITMNGRPLLLITVLALIIIYIHALFAFLILQYIYLQNSHMAASLFQMTLTTMREGLLFGMKRVDYPLPNVSRRNFGNFLVVVTFGLVFYVTITLVGLNVIFGMIVDAFRALRNSKVCGEKVKMKFEFAIERFTIQLAFELDMQSRCFICERASFEFEQKGISFEYHMKSEHNMMAYVFLMCHISDTDQQRLSASEMHIDSLIHQDNLSFFPKGQAISLDGVKVSNAEDSIEVKLTKKADSIIGQLEDQGKRRAAALRAMFDRGAHKKEPEKTEVQEKPNSPRLRKVPLNEQEEFDQLATDFVGRQKSRQAQRRSAKGQRQTPTVGLDFFLQADTTGHGQTEDGPLAKPDFIENIPEVRQPTQLPFRPKGNEQTGRQQ